MEPYTKNIYRYSWRNTDSTRNNIRKSLGLPAFPSRKWSSKTYSSASSSDETSGSMSELIDDVGEDDLAEANEHNTATDSEPASKLLEVVVTLLLVVFSSLGGPATTLIVCAVIFLYDWIKRRVTAEKQCLEAQQEEYRDQKQKHDAREIKLLLDIFRSTVLIEQFKTTRPMQERRNIMPENLDLLQKSCMSLRDHFDAGSLVRGSKECEEYFKLELLLYQSYGGD